MHEGHRNRLKERFLTEGLDSFQQHNILELLLFYAIPRRDTNEIAHLLLERFGSISDVFDAPIRELMKVDGIGEHAAILLKMIPQLACVYMDDKNDVGQIISTSEAAAAFFRTKFIGRINEVVAALFVDNRGKLREYSIISEGTVNAAQLNIRKIIMLCMGNEATSVFIAHNHPKGFALPSRDDIDATARLKSALATINVSLLDHLIFGEDGECVSLAHSMEYSRMFK